MSIRILNYLYEYKGYLRTVWEPLTYLCYVGTHSFPEYVECVGAGAYIDREVRGIPKVSMCPCLQPCFEADLFTAEYIRLVVCQVFGILLSLPPSHRWVGIIKACYCIRPFFLQTPTPVLACKTNTLPPKPLSIYKGTLSLKQWLFQ